jgi:hypothetical protein
MKTTMPCSKQTVCEVTSGAWEDAYQAATAKYLQRAGNVQASLGLLERIMDVTKLTGSEKLAPAVRTCLQKLWCRGGAGAAGCEC